MSIKHAVQALSEPVMRDALAVGISELLREVRAVTAMAYANGVGSNARQGFFRSKRGNSLSRLNERMRAEPAAERAGDFASQLVSVLVDDMKGVVGLGSDDGILLLDRAGIVHGMNRAAKGMVACGFLSEGHSGTLVLADRCRNKRFRSAFQQFCGVWPEELRVLVDRETVVVLRPAFLEASAVSMIAVTVRQVGGRIDVPPEKVQAVLKVTPKQAEVARAVMQGLSPSQFAQESGCSLKMARFHLYELMRKVGCRSQAELGTYLTRIFE